MALFNFGVLASIAHSFRRMWPTLVMVETPTGTAVNLQGDENGYPYVNALIGGGTGAVAVEGNVADGAAPTANDYPVNVGGIVYETDPAPLVDGIIKRLRLDYLQRLWVRSAAFDSAAQADRNFPVVDLASRRVTTPVQLLAANQTIAGSATWEDLGPEISTDGYTRIGLWVAIQNNDDTHVKVRCLAKHTAAGTAEYPLPILKADTSAAGSYQVYAEEESIEIYYSAINQTRLMLLTWVLDNVVPYVQFQVQSTTTGADRAVVIAADTKATWAWGQ